MRCFLACVMKDVRLFFSRKSAVLLLALPVLLLAVLMPGFGETTSAHTYVKPFSFVICDLDDSVMSRSLINQLRQFELFDEIKSTKEQSAGTDWFDNGYVACITIPKGFFYAMYDMDNLAVTVEFNPDKPVESAILEAVFISVTDIVASEQKARTAEFRLQYEAGMAPDRDVLYYESANYELKRALSRRNVFSDFQLLEDYTENSAKAAYATVTAMICMLIPLSMLRGLPEELSLSIVDRLKCTGRGLFTLIFSKFFAALILFVLLFAAMTAAVRPSVSVPAYVSAIMLFVLSYSLFGIVSISTRESSKAQLTGNIIVMLFILFGGALYPYQMLPQYARYLAYASPVLYYLRGINGVNEAVIVLTVAALSVSVLLIFICWKPIHLKPLFIPGGGSRSTYDETAVKTGRADILSIVWFKMLAMTGGRTILAVMLAVSLICFSAVDGILDGKTAKEIVIAVEDSDDSELSRAYIKELENENSVKIIECRESKALKKLNSGEAEAVLIIEKGFDRAFLHDKTLPLKFYSAAAGAASDACREICGGKLLSMQSSFNAVSRLISDGVIGEEEKQLFYEQLDAVEAEAKPIIEFINRVEANEKENTVYGRIYARYSGFAALMIFLFLMSLSVLLSGNPARAVKKAMSAAPGGYFRYVITDHLALVLTGVFLSCAALILRKDTGAGEVFAYFLYVNCVAGLCLLISLNRAGGGADMTATVFALLTGTVGGCFFDFASLGGAFKVFSYLTPQGMLIGAVSGSGICFIAMTAVTAFCYAVYYAAGRRA